MNIEAVITPRDFGLLRGAVTTLAKFRSRTCVFGNPDRDDWAGQDEHTTNLERALKATVNLMHWRDENGRIGSGTRIGVLDQEEERYKVDYTLPWSKIREMSQARERAEWEAIRNRTCIIIKDPALTANNFRYYIETAAQLTPDRSEAIERTVEWALGNCAWGGDLINILIEEPIPEGRTCLIGRVLPLGLINMLKASPNNAVFRTKALAYLKVELPVEIVEFEPLKDWIETQFKPPVGYIRPMADPEPVSVAIPQPTNGNPIFLEVDATQRESGTANYARTLYGEGRVGVSNSDLEDMAEDSESLRDLIDRISDHIHSNFGGDMEPSEDDDAPEMWDFNPSQHDELNLDFDREELQRQLSQWLQQHRPDLYEELVANR